jgi:hypothetical protein
MWTHDGYIVDKSWLDQGLVTAEDSLTNQMDQIFLPAHLQQHLHKNDAAIYILIYKAPTAQIE